MKPAFGCVARSDYVVYVAVVASSASIVHLRQRVVLTARCGFRERLIATRHSIHY